MDRTRDAHLRDVKRQQRRQTKEEIGRIIEGGAPRRRWRDYADSIFGHGTPGDVAWPSPEAMPTDQQFPRCPNCGGRTREVRPGKLYSCLQERRSCGIRLRVMIVPRHSTSRIGQRIFVPTFIEGDWKVSQLSPFHTRTWFEKDPRYEVID